jgi:hypothetical protein
LRAYEQTDGAFEGGYAADFGSFGMAHFYARLCLR